MSSRKPYNPRARSHDAAHGADDPHEAVVDMELVHRGEPELVATQDALASLIDKLRTDGSFAYDSEFIGESSYHPKLCLIQVASKSSLAIVDPLSGIDVTPFWE